MLVVHVHIHVKADSVEAFRRATVENARHSLEEPGVARFDVVQQVDNPARFVLVEVYRSAADPPRHRQTAHYAAWRQAVEPMMAEARSKVEYASIFPADAGWG